RPPIPETWPGTARGIMPGANVSGQTQQGGAQYQDAGAQDACRPQALAQTQAGDQGAEQDRGFPQGGDDGDRRQCHGPQGDSVGHHGSEAACQAGSPVGAQVGRQGAGPGAQAHQGHGASLQQEDPQCVAGGRSRLADPGPVNQGIAGDDGGVQQGEPQARGRRRNARGAPPDAQDPAADGGDAGQGGGIQ